MIRYPLSVIFLIFVLACTPPQRHLRERYVNDNPEMKPEIKDAILDGDVIIGMTEYQVYASWATPIFKGITEYNGKKLNYWIYPDMKGSPFVNIYFSNKIVVEIEKTEIGPPPD